MTIDQKPARRPAILVTGGLGFIGGHLLDRLVAAGFRDIRVLDNFHRPVCASKKWPDGAVSVSRGDIRDFSTLREQMEGRHLVYHLAAQSKVIASVNDPDYTFSTNVTGTLNVLRAARQAGARRVVFASSREVYGNGGGTPTTEDDLLLPVNEYGASKAAAEMYCYSEALREGLEVVVLRVANAYGAYDRDRVIPLFVTAALQGEPLILYGGDQVVDFVWIDTVVDAFIRAGLEDYICGPINIGSGVGTTVCELCNKVIELTSSTSECICKPSRSAEVSRFVADIRRSQRVLRMPVIVDPLDHLADVVAWCQAHAAGRTVSRLG